MRRRLRWRRLLLVTVVTGLLAAGGTAVGLRGQPPRAARSPRAAPPAGVPAVDGLPAVQYSPLHPPPPWPGPLPYPIIIADKGNRRIIEVTPRGQVVWQFPPRAGRFAGTAGVPGDDAFFSPDGTLVTTNDEDHGTILRFNYYTGQIVWHFGQPGVQRGGTHHLNYPDDAYLLPDGNTIVADIRNCRELTIGPNEQILRIWGVPQHRYCQTDPAAGLYGYPNGDTPQPNGDILESFISGNRVALLSPSGAVIWDVTVPDMFGGYVSDAQLLRDGDVLAASYGVPGAAVIFNPHTGKVAWVYHVTSGPGMLSYPSLALPLPNGNIILTDDSNDRVVVIDPRSGRIVWQYGHTGVAGSGPGYLNIPDGLDVDQWRNWRGWLTAAAHRTG